MLIEVLPGSLPAYETYIFPIRNNSERASFEPLQIRFWKSESAEGYFGEKTAFFSNKASRCGILTHLPFAPTRARAAARLAAYISSRAPCRLTAYARTCARARERYGGRTPPTPPPVPLPARSRRRIVAAPRHPPIAPPPASRLCPSCEPCSSGKFVLETSISRSYNASLRLRVYGYTRARG